MKTIRIRKFTVLSLFFIFLLPWIFFLDAHFMETKTLHFDMTDSERKELNETIHLIETHSENWTDKAWQKQLSRHLQKVDMSASILSASDQVIFETAAVRKHIPVKPEQFSVIEDGRIIGRVALYHSSSRTIQWMAAFIGFILALLIIGMAMRRWMITPLEQLGLSARKIANGDFDARLPSSKITEIAEVRDGFNIMVNGLQEAFQKQVELEDERRFMIAAVAHDLRTPLFALRGYLDGLEQGIAQSPEKMTKYVAVCKEKSAQLDRLVEDLFTFTKTEYVEMELNKKTVDFSQVLKQSINTIRPQAQQKKITIVERAFEHECMISGDPHLLKRAMNNLLDNAVRHTPGAGEIVVQCDKDRDNVIFTVRDTGQGFSPEELRRVFEPLYRGEASRSRSTGGAGLGLTISQRIMRRHGGDLTAGNDPEGGALLEGWLPLEREKLC